MRATILIALVLLGVAAGPAHALRCGGRVIAEGDSTLRLTRFCGQPALVEQHEDRVPVRRYDELRREYYTGYNVEPYAIWVYNFGPRRFIQRIEIRNGLIEKISNGGYGY